MASKNVRSSSDAWIGVVEAELRSLQGALVPHASPTEKNDQYQQHVAICYVVERLGRLIGFVRLQRGEKNEVK